VSLGAVAPVYAAWWQSFVAVSSVLTFVVVPVIFASMKYRQYRKIADCSPEDPLCRIGHIWPWLVWSVLAILSVPWVTITIATVATQSNVVSILDEALPGFERSWHWYEAGSTMAIVLSALALLLYHNYKLGRWGKNRPRK
jgi:hypothetical protein